MSSSIHHRSRTLSSLSAARTHAAAPLVDTRRQFEVQRGELPESITMDEQGNVFLSMSNFISKLTPNGTMSTYAILPLPRGALALGLKFGPDGCLYCASGAFAEQPAAAFVWRIAGAHSVEPFAALDAHGFPNDLAFDRRGFAYVTDPFLGRIYRIDRRGVSRVWLQHPSLFGNAVSPALSIHAFGVDGIAFDLDQQHLYVGNLDAGEILRIPIGASGEPGAPITFAKSALLRGADGLAFDRSGVLYVAVNGQDRLMSIDVHGELTVMSEGAPLDAPSSLVFGTLPGDEQTLYVASFAINRATGAHTGLPKPALHSVRVSNGGLRLLARASA